MSTTPVAPIQEVKSEITFRLCEERDSEAIAKIVAESVALGLIDTKDIARGKRAVEPSVLWAVAEKDGVVICAAPIHIVGFLPHLAINGESSVDDRKRGLIGLQDFFSVLLKDFYKVKSILTLCKSQYKIAEFAVANGWRKESRELFVLDIPKYLEIAKEEIQCVSTEQRDSQQGTVN